MNIDQVKSALFEFEVLKRELAPVADGFGYPGLKISVKLKNGDQWDLVELQGAGTGDKTSETACGLRGVSRVEKTPGQVTWFAVFFDYADVLWIEFEVFAG